MLVSRVQALHMQSRKVEACRRCVSVPDETASKALTNLQRENSLPMRVKQLQTASGCDKNLQCGRIAASDPRVSGAMPPPLVQPRVGDFNHSVMQITKTAIAVTPSGSGNVEL